MTRLHARAAGLFVGLFVALAVSPASAWWQYAEWGLSPAQLMTASAGHAVPCRPDVPVCAAPPGGLPPSYMVESLIMVGMTGSASFAFEADNRLVQAVVLFPTSDIGLVTGLLQGIHGAPVSETGSVWRDERRGTAITALLVGGGAMMIYRPMGR